MRECESVFWAEQQSTCTGLRQGQRGAAGTANVGCGGEELQTTGARAEGSLGPAGGGTGPAGAAVGMGRLSFVV